MSRNSAKTPVSDVEVPAVVEPDYAPGSTDVPAAPEASKRTRHYSATCYLDTSDASEFYLLIVAGGVVSGVFSFNPATCQAVDKSASRMMLAAARGLLKDKSTLVKLATYRLEATEVTPGCPFHADAFLSVFNALAVAFTLNMPRPENAS